MSDDQRLIELTTQFLAGGAPASDAPHSSAFLTFLKRTIPRRHPPESAARFTCQGRPVASNLWPPLGSDVEKRLLVNWFRRQDDPTFQKHATIALTYDCSRRCGQCYVSEFVDPSRRELSACQMRTVFTKLAEEVGAWHFDLTGGEPFEREDFFDVVEQIPRDRATAIVATNGLHLARNLARIRESNIMVFKVSLNSYSQTGAERREILKAIETLLANGLFTFVQSYVQKGCAHDQKLPTLIEACKRIGVPKMHLISPMRSGNLAHRPDVLLTTEDRDYLYGLCREHRDDSFAAFLFPDWEFAPRRRGRGCSAGRGRLYVSAYGDLFPCNFLRERCYGNVLTDDVRAMIRAMHEQIPVRPDCCPRSNVEPSAVPANAFSS